MPQRGKPSPGEFHAALELRFPIGDEVVSGTNRFIVPEFLQHELIGCGTGEILGGLSSEQALPNRAPRQKSEEQDNQPRVAVETKHGGDQRKINDADSGSAPSAAMGTDDGIKPET